MRGIAQFLIRLYPANWRERYGEEFEALVEDSPPGWLGIFDLVKGAIKMQLSVPAFPKLALMLSITGLLAGLAISFAVDPTYVSTATITLHDSTSSAPSGVRPNLRDYFLQMEQEILSRTSLSIIIQDPHLDLYREERGRKPLEDVIEQMRKDDAKFTMGAPGSNYLDFRITFAYSDPVKARDTVQALITKFVEINLVRQRVPAYVKRQRSYDQIDRMEARIAALEKRLGIPPSPPEPLDEFAPVSGGIVMEVLDPPSLPVDPVKPNRSIFMATGFGAGLAAAVVIAVFRRRPPPIPFPAQTA
jgi:uncharacterized protein involved in exopolysaccharide biosynthesis